MNILRMIDRWSAYDYRENVYETQIVKEALPHPFARVSTKYPRSLISFLGGGPAAPIAALREGTVQRIVTPDEIAADGCVLLLPMNESTGDYAYDLSGHGNHGHLGGGVEAYKPSWTTLPDGRRVLDFNGLNNYIDCGRGDSLDIPDDLTIAFRGIIRSLADWKTIISSGDSGYAKDHPYLVSTYSGTLAYYTGNGASYIRVLMTPAPPLNELLRAIVVKNGTNLQWYLNGMPRGSEVLTLTPTTFARCLIGAMQINRWNLDSLFKEIRLYKRAMSPMEARALSSL